MDVDDVLRNAHLLDSYAALQAVERKQLLEPFQTSVIDDQPVMALPSNISEICSNNYLIALGIRAYSMPTKESSEYKFVTLENKTWRARKELNNEDVQFLKGLGLPLCSGQFQTKVRTKGALGRGLRCALDFNIKSYKKFDRGYCKYPESPHPRLSLFGTAWNMNPVENKFLDRILAVIRHMDFSPAPGHHLSDVLLNTAEIEKRTKLRLDYKSKLLTSNEKTFIESVLIDDGVEAEYSLPEIPDNMVDDFEIFNLLKSSVKDRLAVLKRYKSVISDVVEKRVRACYAPYKTAAQKKKVAKVPVEKLARDLDTVDDIMHFNPTSLCYIRQGGYAVQTKTLLGDAEGAAKQLNDLRRLFVVKEDRSKIDRLDWTKGTPMEVRSLFEPLLEDFKTFAERVERVAAIER